MDEIAGLPRHISQHSGGMVISSAPLVELVPVLPAAMEGRRICQWDKDSCADAGFLKIDLLGLGMLSAVEECVDLIARTAAEPVDLSRIGFDDPEVYAEIQAADTVGVFQIESRAQMQSLVRTQPENLDDLTVQVALVRPGPIVGDAVNPYVKRRQELRRNPDYEVPYDHPLLREVLADTLGVVVFQDQVLEVAMALAGFTTGEAESLRRAMSRKRSREALEGHWQRFRDGAVGKRRARRDGRSWCSTSWSASRSSASPSRTRRPSRILAYQSAWLHRHYPAEFLCSLLNAQPMGFYPPATLLRDGERRGVTMLPPGRQRAAWPAARSRAATACGSASATSRASASRPRTSSPSATAAAPSPTPATWCGGRPSAATRSPSWCGRARSTASTRTGAGCCGRSACTARRSAASSPCRSTPRRRRGWPA